MNKKDIQKDDKTLVEESYYRPEYNNYLLTKEELKVDRIPWINAPKIIWVISVE